MSEIRVDTISEKTSANGVAVDGVTLKDGGFTATLGSTITTADNTTQLTLKSTDADASVGPDFVLQRDSGSPADDDSLGRIRFVADNDAGEALDHISINATIRDASDGTEDAQLTFNMLTAGAVVDAFHISPTETVFNDASADRNFRIESNGNDSMLVVDGENNRVGIGTSSPGTGTTLHLNNTSTVLKIQGASANNAYIDFTAANTWTIGTNTGAGVNDNSFGIVDGSNIAIECSTSEVIINQNSQDIDFRVESNNQTHMFFIDGGAEFVSTGDTAPDVSRLGLCLNQAGNDGNILTLKSSDIAHGMTDNAETDTYFFIKKNNPTEGGVYMQGHSETASPGIRITGATTTASTGEAANVEGSIHLEGSLKSNNSIDAHGADDNILIVRNHGTTNFIVKGDGELFSNQSATVGTYDAYEDAQLVRAYDLNHMQGVINSKFDKFVQYNKDDLVKARLIGKDENGNATSFVNWTGMSRLHNGAIWQQYEKHQKLASAFYKLATKTIGKEEADKLLTEEEIQLLN